MELFSRKYILIALATAVTVASVGLGIFFSRNLTSGIPLRRVLKKGTSPPEGMAVPGTEIDKGHFVFTSDLEIHFLNRTNEPIRG